MYPYEPTEMEKMLEFIKREDETDREMLQRKVREHEMYLHKYSIGQEYYENRSDILRLGRSVGADGVIDEKKPHNQLSVNYQKLLVDQKVSYVASNPISLKHENEKIIELIHDTLTDRFDDRLIDILTTASNKGVEYVHIYIDEDGNVNTMRVPPEQFIPIYKNSEREEMVEAIWVRMLDGVKRVSHYTKDDVTHYMYYGGQLVLDYYFGETNPTTHFDGGSWGKVPFVAFKNNSLESPDIDDYKTLVDAFERRLSDLANTFDESTETIYVLKNYEAQDLSDFKRMLRHYGALKVDDDGGVDTIKVDIPVQATKDYLQDLHEKIILTAQGIDFNSDKFGNSPSGIALQFLFSNLDLKAKKLSRKTHIAIQEIIWFIFEHHNINVDNKEVEITFNFNTMVNELEKSQIAVQSVPILSKETIIEKHPWVTDPAGELERLNEGLLPEG